jgi:GH15 family glucan-1,4-alpha-glucosidase
MYPPISDYAIIGNRHTCALVARDGSIDWCCVPHLDSPSIFAAILDARRGGRWRVAPAGEATATRSYMGPSAVLETEFRGAGGRLVLTDFLPIRRGRETEPSQSAPALVRRIRCVEGEIDVAVEWTPRPSYARADVELAWQGDAILAQAPESRLWLTGLPNDARTSLRAASATAILPLRGGEQLDLICGWGEPFAPVAELAEQYLRATLEWWTRWAAECRIEPGADAWADMVLRSGMVLKLLTNERTGAIAAAPTTSLPEEIGGIRNWDYRFCWVRDSSMIARAFVALGQPQDGVAFLSFLEQAAQQHRDPSRIQIMYGLQGETRLTEYTLGHLDGYCDSRPVRIGNAAAHQRQLDVYGELLDAAYDLLRIGSPPGEQQWTWLTGIADYVCEIWKYKDRGIWEVRGPERHFTYSKLMCWVALDRALKIADELGWTGDTSRWRSERAAIRAAILEQGFDARRNTFVQSFSSPALDASNLLIPVLGFLPATDPRMLGTIDAVIRELTENGLVHRYLPDDAPDGVGGGEGAFGICTFWLCNALTLAGRIEQAQELFTGMLARANDVGLYSEEIDPDGGIFLGNFPQAFSHIGLINTAHFLGRALASGSEVPQAS